MASRFIKGTENLVESILWQHTWMEPTSSVSATRCQPWHLRSSCSRLTLERPLKGRTWRQKVHNQCLWRLMGYNCTFSQCYSTRVEADGAFVYHSSVTTCDSCLSLYSLTWPSLDTLFFIGGDSWDGRVQGSCFCEIDFSNALQFS